MNPIRLVAVDGGRTSRPPLKADETSALLDAIAAALSRELHTSCTFDGALDATFAHHPERNQYHSTAILDRLALNAPTTTLGVTSLDLYIPILTFVFGEAQLGGTCAVVSYHRLAQEFYGLPPDPLLRKERLIKEAIHELGHTAALTHCDDYECVMAASHAVEWLDLKSARLCAQCRAYWPS
ncbi:MAG TPA: peptidase M54 [Thermoanaerobaculia bacterium]|nr:peptidase M54 [Thermoanaerobaculia bacterium]